MIKTVELKAIKKDVRGIYYVRAYRAAYKCESINFESSNVATLNIIEAIDANEYYAVTAYEFKL